MRSNQGTPTAPRQIPEGYVWIGQVGRPHGVRGSFFLRSADQRTDWPGYQQLVFHSPLGDGTLNIEKAYQSGGKLALQAREWTTREQCEERYSSHLFVRRDLIKTSEDEYLVGEMIGCDVEVEGRPGVFGKIIAIHNFGAQETLEIQRVDSLDTVLFPFLDNFVLTVDQEKRRVVVVDEPAFLDGQ